MTRPVIGLCTYAEPARWGAWEDRVALLPWSYVAAVQRAGGLALLLPPDPVATQAPDEVLDRLDGLVVAGGRDVDPRRYGAEPHPETDPPATERDAFELALSARAIERDLPFLGICRGMQVLNVALGGTLYRDRSEYPAAARDHPGGDWARWELVCDATLGRGDMPEHPSHPIHIAAGSRLAGVLGDRAVVNSYHHQAVKDVGEGLEVVARSDDGMIEGIEHADRDFVLGVQWEAQQAWQDGGGGLALFRRFVEAAREASSGAAAADRLPVSAWRRLRVSA